jgi:hypothetical protein
MRQRIGQTLSDLPPIGPLTALMKCSIPSGLCDINIVASTWCVHVGKGLVASSASSIDIDLSPLYEQAHDAHVWKLPLDG